ncbi:hypothetical protein GCM10009801_48710 [Streptomyces albiaxialis]|uniref:CdiI immunity protein domain-containing protein n=1 Tax=Streptomyces albiaxialis TaxID=329523 RepID=A0ABN2W963_9ACTN
MAQEPTLHGDFDLARRFQHFASYAEGELFLEILEHYYDEEARERSEEGMRRTIAMGADRAVAALDVLCRDNPDATAAGARDLFRGIARSADYLGLGKGTGESNCPLGRRDGSSGTGTWKSCSVTFPAPPPPRRHG